MADRSDRARVAVPLLVTSAASIALAVTYATGGQAQLEGILLAVAFGGLGVGFVAWSRLLLPQEQVTEERPLLAADEETVDAVEDELAVGSSSRRGFLGWVLGLSFVSLAGALAFPVRSLGPSPGRVLFQTPWRRGVRAVNAEGTLVRAVDVPPDGLVTVFPEGSPGSADGQAVLMRVDPKLLRPRAGREGWSPDGLVAYSKVCSHAGCPVGLYQPETHSLLCPCHQSTFDVLDGARPLRGPAAAPLPQLPLTVDGDGYVTATGDFSDPVGPAFWHRS